MYNLSSSLTTFLILTALPRLVDTPTLLSLLELSLSALDDLLPVDFLCSVIDEAFLPKSSSVGLWQMMYFWVSTLEVV